MARLLQLQGLPPQYLRAVSAQEASDLAGVALGADAWHYPGGGWIAPPAWVGLALAQPGVRLVCGIEVDRLLPCDGQWRLCDRAGRVVAQAPLVVLANATGASRLLAPLGYAPWPLSQTRGQVTHWDAGTPTPLRRPVSGDGYVLPGPRGGLLCGATRDPATPSGSAEDIEVRQADHLRNLARLRALTGLLPPSDSAHWQGRTGWRLHSDDRLPVVGALPLVAAPPGQRQDQARLLPRSRGLFVFTALGARGLTLAPLLARLVAAQATGSPWPLEQELADAIDPVRWIVRRARAGAGRAAAQPADG
jgi:tRNA 5-methylaminomethyl-2-thiouridine biosynthesis bifunctional protein